jgi:hypothetical protein
VIEVDIGSDEDSDDLHAEVRWARDNYALVRFNEADQTFTISVCAVGPRPVPVDLSEFRRALDHAQRRLAEVYGVKP